MSGCSDLQRPKGTATPARDLRRWEHSLMSWPSRFPCSSIKNVEWSISLTNSAGLISGRRYGCGPIAQTFYFESLGASEATSFFKARIAAQRIPGFIQLKRSVSCAERNPTHLFQGFEGAPRLTHTGIDDGKSVCYIRAIDRVLRDGKLLERLLTFANRIRDSVRNFSFFEQLKISISSSTLFLITEDISAVTSHWESSQHCLLPAGHLDPSPPSRTILPRLCRRRRLSCHPLSQSQIHGEAYRR